MQNIYIYIKDINFCWGDNIKRNMAGEGGGSFLIF
jgi:hypothetical protein